MNREYIRFEKGIEMLHDSILVDAFHTTKEEGNATGCHPRTREIIISQIHDWIRTPNARNRFIMWLNGPAGSGKSAIARTIAEICMKEGILAASFFFSHTSGFSRSNTCSVIPTIAYQLASSILALRQFIGEAVKADCAILEETLNTQFEELILDPIKAAYAIGSTGLHPILIILDGLNEIEKDSERGDILDVLDQYSKELEKLPLKFLLVSRPDDLVRTKINESTIGPLIEEVALDDSTHPDKDIETYLARSLEIIRVNHPGGGASNPQTWPTDIQIRRLVEKASGLFIYASTAAQYIQSPYHIPSQRLDAILHMTNASRTRFAELDALYTHILGSVDNPEMAMNILTVITVKPSKIGYYAAPTIKFLDILFGCNGESTASALKDIYPLVFVPPSDQEYPRLFHASLQDFLTDRARSRSFFIGAKEAHTRLATCFLRLMNNPDTLDTESHPLRNLIMSSFVHCENAKVTQELSAMLASLDLKSLLSRNARGFWTTSLVPVFKYAGNMVSPKFGEMLKEQFFSWLLDLANQYPPLFRSFIPTLLAVNLGSSVLRDLFIMLLNSFDLSSDDINRAIQVDETLLNLSSKSFKQQEQLHMISNMFCDPVRAGTNLVTGTKFAQLAYHLVDLLSRTSAGSPCGRSVKPIGDSDGQSIDALGLKDSSLEFFDELLRLSSNDAELAAILQSSIPVWKGQHDILNKYARKNMIKYSLEYIKHH